MPGLQFDSSINNGFQKDLRKMNSQYNAFGKNVTSQNQKIDKSFLAIQKTVVGLGAGFALGAATKELITFTNELETALVEVATISKIVTDDFEGYRDAIIELTTQDDLAASSAKQLTEAFYDIVSAGHDGTAGLKILEVSARAATAGFVEASTAADGITTVLNAWSLSADEAANVSDVFFKTVEKGKTTFPELGQNIAQVAPLASAMGVSFEEVSGAVATITKQGTPTAQAFTQIRSALIAMDEQLGKGWASTMTLQEGFQALQDKADDTGKSVKDITGRVEGALAVLATAGKNARGAAEDLDSMSTALGATAAAAQKVTETTSHQIKTLKNNILAAFAPLGEEAGKAISSIVEKLNEAFQSGDVVKYTKILLKLMAAFATYKVATIAFNRIQKIQKATQQAMRLEYALSGKTASRSAQLIGVANKRITGSFNKVNAAFAANPIGLIITALTAAIPVIINVTKQLESSEKKLSKINEEINKQFAQESAGLDILQKQLNESNLTYDEKAKLIEQLNSEYGEYLPSLLTEKSSQEEINAAIEIANDNLREQIRLRVLNTKAAETATKIYELEEKIQKASSRKIAQGYDQVAQALQLRISLLVHNLQQEKEAYDEILSEIGQANKSAAAKISPVTGGGTPDPETGLSDDALEKRRKARLKALEVENQKRVNLITQQYSGRKDLEDEFQTQLLNQQLNYLGKLRNLTKDQLKKLKVEAGIISAETQLFGLSGKEQEELDALALQFQTYIDKKKAIEEKYQDDIDTLRKNGYNTEAIEAEAALDKELKRLDKSIVSSNEAFNDWLKNTLPNLAKEGIKALSDELSVLKQELQTGGLDPKQVVIYIAKIEELESKLSDLRDPVKDVGDTFKDTLSLINDINQLAEDLTESFGDLSSGAQDVLTGIVALGTGILIVGTKVKILATEISLLEKASIILAVISTAVQVISKITSLINAKRKKEREERDAAYLKEISQVQAINKQLIEQNRLYKEGNELLSDDRWGTALSGLDAYNAALDLQAELFKNINEGAAAFYGGGLLERYPDLIDANGKLDLSILQLIRDTEQLSEVDAKRLDNIIEVTELAQDAFGQFGDYVSGIFGSVGDDITKAFQLMHEEGTDAMTSLEGSFSEMIESFTRDAIEFAFLQPLLNQLNEATKELGEDYARGEISANQLQSDIINTLGSFYDSLNDIQPEILKAYENADKLAAQAGFESAFEPTKQDDPIDVEIIEDESQDQARAGRIREAITEETGSMMVGRMGAIMLSNERIANHSQDALDYAIQNLVTLNKIKENTDFLPEIANNTRKTAESLESI